eukprot:GEMP01007863.1.p1 GENE.GEMP01007863.1~~GEMP01007863.1.p1  ORF type:complete len:568 (+),score=111.64 GEMP01007863.1:97-1800(+)
MKIHAQADAIQDFLLKLHRLLAKKEVALDDLPREYEDFHGEAFSINKLIEAEDTATALEKLPLLVQLTGSSKGKIATSALNSASEDAVTQAIRDTLSKILPAEDAPRTTKVRKKSKNTPAPVDKERINSFVSRAFCKILSARAVSVADIPKLFKQKYEVDLAQALESCGFRNAEAYLSSQEEAFELFEQEGVRMAKLAPEPKPPSRHSSVKRSLSSPRRSPSRTPDPSASSPQEGDVQEKKAVLERASGDRKAVVTVVVERESRERDARDATQEVQPPSQAVRAAPPKAKKTVKSELTYDKDRFPSKASGIRPMVLSTRRGSSEETDCVAPAISKAPSVPHKARAFWSRRGEEKDRRREGRKDRSQSRDGSHLSLGKRSPSRRDVSAKTPREAVPEVSKVVRERSNTGDACELDRLDAGDNAKRRRTAVPTAVDVRDWPQVGQLLEEIQDAEAIGLGFDAPSCFSVASGTKLYSVSMECEFSHPIQLAIITAILQAAACRSPIDGVERAGPRVGGRWKAHVLPNLLSSPVGPAIKETTMVYALAQAALKFEETNADAWSSVAILRHM